MTRERIIMKYNGNGELLFISAEFLHAFDIFENGIDEKKMLEVEATVLNNFDGNLVTLKELCMGNDGLPYMNAVFRYEDKKTGKLKSSSVWYRISAK